MKLAYYNLICKANLIIKEIDKLCLRGFDLQNDAYFCGLLV